jgi:cytochrome d ubiquinol oxidase subunit I
VWATFLIIVVLYVGVGVTLVLILRRISRRWREQPALAETETDVPYGPREPIPHDSAVDEQEPVG